MENFIKSIIAIIGTIVTFLLGGWSTALQVLVIFIIIDFIFGYTVAWMLGEASSKIGFRGIAKKVIILALVAVAYSIDTIMGDNTLIRDTVIFFYLANELLSIIETAGKAGIPIPEVLRDSVASLKRKGGPDG